MTGKGRPTAYTDAIATEICDRLAAGESLRSICRDEHMPHESTVRKWGVENYEGFYTQYARARDIGLDAIADETLEIADTPLIGEKRKERPDGSIEIERGDAVDRARLKVDTRKWYLGKLAPKRYGNNANVELTGKDGGPIQTQTEMSDQDRALLNHFYKNHYSKTENEEDE